MVFDKFDGFEKSVEKFKKTLANFEESKNELFDAVVYGLMFLKQENFQQLAGILPKKTTLKTYWVTNFF